MLDSGNVVILRSLTKDHALAGVRLGYMIAPTGIVSAVRQRQYPWSVNAVAQQAGVAALQDEEYLETTREFMHKAKQHLCQLLDAAGIQVMPSSTNFLLAKVGDAKTVRASLLQRGMVVRDCTSFGLSAYVRITVRPPAECAQLVAALCEVLAR